MVDLQEPNKKQYSDEEQTALREQFVLLLHTLLLTYLVLHNFLIPIISNLVIGRNLLSDIHFWFLFQIPVQFYLRKRYPISSWYFYFLLIGTITRLILEVQIAPSLKSWNIFSLFLSELSSIIFYFLYFPFLKEKSLNLTSFIAIIFVPLISLMELRSEKFIPSQAQVHGEKTNESLGCNGSSIKLDFPLERPNILSSSSVIKECGFSAPLLRVDEQFIIRNRSTIDINLRLYKLKVLHGKISWRFVRLVQVAHDRDWDLTPLLRSEKTVLLLKSPERRKIGNLIIIPRDFIEFPLGSGELSSTYDTLKWSPHE